MPRLESRPLVLGVPVSALSFSETLARLMAWGHARESRYVVLANAHVVVTAARETAFGAAVAEADMTCPDGAPVAWMLRKLGHTELKRLSGPDLTWVLLERCADEGLPVYFFGSTNKTLGLLADRIHTSFPKLNVVGLESPPFRAITAQEDAESVERINASGAGLVFIGLGCPKQEHWMQAHRGRVNAVMLGVGAAFDFHAGTVPRAPLWMREHGLEWLHRLASEPKRLWQRYLITNTLFILMAAKQLLGVAVSDLAPVRWLMGLARGCDRARALEDSLNGGMSRKVAYFLMTLLLLALLVGTQIPGAWRAGIEQGLHAPSGLSSIAHFVLFACMALLQMVRPLNWSLTRIGLTALALALLSEGLQFFAVERHPRWLDVGIDLAGTLAGLSWGNLLYFLRFKRS